jgi:hypothetical protein
MARKGSSRKTTRRTRRKSGVSIIGLAETYVLTNVMTQAMFRTSPIQFLMGGNISGSGIITLGELMNPKGRFYDNPDMPGVQGATYYIQQNLKAQGGKAVANMILIPIAFRLGKSLARPAISRTNKLLNKVNIGSTVKL